MPLEDFPGIAHTWVSTRPSRRARLIYVSRPDGQALFQVNAPLGRVAEAESGWLVCENWKAQQVRMEFQRGKGLTWDGESVKPDAVPKRLRVFAMAGR